MPYHDNPFMASAYSLGRDRERRHSGRGLGTRGCIRAHQCTHQLAISRCSTTCFSMILPDPDVGVDAGVSATRSSSPGGNNAARSLRLLGNGSAFNLPHINYTSLEGEGGIAVALRRAEHFAAAREAGQVMLGEQCHREDIRRGVAAFLQIEARGARLLEGSGQPARSTAWAGRLMARGIALSARIEKPETTLKSNYAVIGTRMYDPEVFKIIRTVLKPSGRGELEITDAANNALSASRPTPLRHPRRLVGGIAGLPRIKKLLETVARRSRANRDSSLTTGARNRRRRLHRVAFRQICAEEVSRLAHRQPRQAQLCGQSRKPHSSADATRHSVREWRHC